MSSSVLYMHTIPFSLYRAPNMMCMFLDVGQAVGGSTSSHLHTHCLLLLVCCCGNYYCGVIISGHHLGVPVQWSELTTVVVDT